jgi:hypothetical protein
MIFQGKEKDGFSREIKSKMSSIHMNNMKEVQSFIQDKKKERYQPTGRSHGLFLFSNLGHNKTKITSYFYNIQNITNT